MRSAVACVAGLVLWLGPAAPRAAGASPSSTPPGTIAASAAVALPQSAAIAYLRVPGRLRVRVPGVGTRDYAVPPDCEPQALARDAVFLCASVLAYRPLLELRLADGALMPVAAGLEPGQVFYPRRAGDAWIEGVLSSESTGGSGKAIRNRAIVSRITGAVVNLDAGFRTAPPGWGQDRYVDLSSTMPLRRLCRPLHRERPTAATRLEGRARLQKVGSWTLRPVAFDPWRLQRCGSSRVLPAGPSPILGPGHAAWVNRRTDGRALRLRDLAAGTTRSFALHRPPSGAAAVRIAFTSDRLVVSQAAGFEQGRRSWAVRTIDLG
jgi:hypothetical protein